MRSWWHHFWNGVSHTAEDIWNKLWSAIDNVISWGESWFDRIAHAVDWVWHFVTSIFQWTARLVPAVWHAIDNVWRWTVHNFFPWVGRMFADAYQWAAKSIGVAVHWVAVIWGDLWNWTRASFHWLDVHVLAPLWGDLRTFGRWVVREFRTTVWHWVQDAAHWAGVGLTYLFRHVADLMTWVNKHLAKWVPVLDKYGGTLLRFLMDPIGFVASIVERITSRGSRWFAHVIMNTLSHSTGLVEDLVSKFLSI